MKRKISKIFALLFIVCFVFTNLGMQASAENLNQTTIMSENDTESDNTNSDDLKHDASSENLIDNPLDDSIMQSIREKANRNLQRNNSYACATYDQSDESEVKKITDCKVSPIIILIKFKGQTDEEAYPQ